MISLKLALALILSLSFAVFVTFFGRLPALRRTPVGFLHRLIWIHVPNFFLFVDDKLTSGRVFKSFSSLGRYLVHDRHPLVVIFFLVLMGAGEFLYLPPVWHRLSNLTRLTVAITVLLPYLFLYLACVSDPGYITPLNHAHHMSLYPYDHALFHPGALCKTCGFLKPPRSKHCSMCKRCIARADHHCIFINSCVGYGNHHWFILLLASTAVLCIYGGVLGAVLLSSSIQQHFLDWSPWHPTRHGWAMYTLLWGWAIQTNLRMGATTLLAALIAPLVCGLLLYTLYLVYCGTTTNESLKWSIYKEDIGDGYAFRRNLPPTRQRDVAKDPVCSRWPVAPQSVLVSTDDGNLPSSNMQVAGEGNWDRVRDLRDVENLYDMGFWDNFGDIFVSNYAFGSKTSRSPGTKRRGRRQSKKYTATEIWITYIIAHV